MTHNGKLRHRLLASAAAFVLGGTPATMRAQADSISRAWNTPVTPFRIVGNLYYVGAADVSAFLLTSAAGHVLIDAGFVETASQIIRNVEALGFRPRDVRTLLITHAHYDHVGGLAVLKQATGARILASAGDAPVLEAGGRNDFHFSQPIFRFPSVAVDGVVSDGDSLMVGGTVLTARLTPGHTKGCTSWTARVPAGAAVRNALILCSVSIPGYQLVGDSVSYPGIADDYARSFSVLRALPCDVPLGSHGSFFNLSGKLARRTSASTVAKEPSDAPGANPFIDPEGCRRMIDYWEGVFSQRLESQRRARHAGVAARGRTR